MSVQPEPTQSCADTDGLAVASLVLGRSWHGLSTLFYTVVAGTLILNRRAAGLAWRDLVTKWRGAARPIRIRPRRAL